MRSTTILALGFSAVTLLSACGGDTDNPVVATPENAPAHNTTRLNPADVNVDRGSDADGTALTPRVDASDLVPPFDNCPADIAAGIDTPGVLDPAADGTAPSAKTFCLERTGNLRIVVALNSAALNGAKTQAQQIANISNIVSDYEKYGLTIGTDVDLVVIGYGAGVRWLLTDSAFDTFFGSDPATAEINPALPIIVSLATKGVKFFACQNTMTNTKIPGTTTNIKTIDLAPDINMVPAGVTALVDFQYQRYRYLAP